MYKFLRSLIGCSVWIVATIVMNASFGIVGVLVIVGLFCILAIIMAYRIALSEQEAALYEQKRKEILAANPDIAYLYLLQEAFNEEK
jgi:hypothetical protein